MCPEFIPVTLRLARTTLTQRVIRKVRPKWRRISLPRILEGRGMTLSSFHDELQRDSKSIRFFSWLKIGKLNWESSIDIILSKRLAVSDKVETLWWYILMMKMLLLLLLLVLVVAMTVMILIYPARSWPGGAIWSIIGITSIKVILLVLDNDRVTDFWNEDTDPPHGYFLRVVPLVGRWGLAPSLGHSMSFPTNAASQFKVIGKTEKLMVSHETSNWRSSNAALFSLTLTWYSRIVEGNSIPHFLQSSNYCHVTNRDITKHW